jgi:hypothetical protein
MINLEQKISDQENPKKILIAELQKLKTDYKDGIPDEIKHSVSEDSGWKVQKGIWFQLVADKFFEIIRRQHGGEKIISEGLYNDILKYCNEFTKNKDNQFKERLTTQEDISKAEEFIDKVITELKV